MGRLLKSHQVRLNEPFPIGTQMTGSLRNEECEAEDGGSRVRLILDIMLKEGAPSIPFSLHCNNSSQEVVHHFSDCLPKERLAYRLSGSSHHYRAAVNQRIDAFLTCNQVNLEAKRGSVVIHDFHVDNLGSLLAVSRVFTEKRDALKLFMELATTENPQRLLVEQVATERSPVFRRRALWELYNQYTHGSIDLSGYSAEKFAEWVLLRLDTRGVESPKELLPFFSARDGKLTQLFLHTINRQPQPDRDLCFIRVLHHSQIQRETQEFLMGAYPEQAFLHLIAAYCSTPSNWNLLRRIDAKEYTARRFLEELLQIGLLKTVAIASEILAEHGDLESLNAMVEARRRGRLGTRTELDRGISALRARLKIADPGALTLATMPDELGSIQPVSSGDLEVAEEPERPSQTGD